jgi:Tfp pilus assembly protein PilV
MNRSSRTSALRRRGFALLEAMLAVAIFALGVLALGRCVSKGLSVERLKNEDARVTRILENRAAEVEAGAVPLKDAQEKISGVNGGVTLTQTRETVHRKNEKDAEMANLFLVKLVATWFSDGEEQSRSMNFYVWSDKL